ncbi:MAG: Co2+/Mg2+ efflux protein ApaG [Alphaproteobacteria bacterium GM7ARS4]|nr:Co2+/Mg2+ efflux protein ApaG [Alphaproteobacteria bacterium GM7ARS4]
MSMHYMKETQMMRVTVQPVYLEEQSDPDKSYYVWAYHIRIENNREDTVTLVGRHWSITDANGVVQEMKGKGVVGEQPVLVPGAAFEYVSGTPLHTCSGFMLGRYKMVSEGGETFHVDIPGFSLDIPHQPRSIN